MRGGHPPISRRQHSRDHEPAPNRSEHSDALSADGLKRILTPIPPVVFTFPDQNRSVSEETADFLVERLHRHFPEAAQPLANRIAEQRNAGTLQEPGRDIDLTTDEKRYLLEVLNAGDWPKDDRFQLRHLQVALTRDIEAAG